jgi:hypothetical protein
MNNYSTPEMSSKVNEVFFTIGQRLAAIRFILALPEGQMMHTKSMPPIVFEYIYICGHLHDLPWLMMYEDDLGTSLARGRRNIHKQELWEMIKKSIIYRRTMLKNTYYRWYVGYSHIEDLEAEIYDYAVRNAMRKKDIF